MRSLPYIKNSTRPSAADWDFTEDLTVLVKCWIHERTLRRRNVRAIFSFRGWYGYAAGSRRELSTHGSVYPTAFRWGKKKLASVADLNARMYCAAARAGTYFALVARTAPAAI